MPDGGSMWVRTVPIMSPLGLETGFQTVIEIGEDFVRSLDAEEVTAYGRHVSAVVASARYEFAALQVGRRRLRLSTKSVAHLLQDLRDAAGELPPPVAGLRWEPLTSATAKGAQVTLHPDGLEPAQMTVIEAAAHLLGVLESVQAARLDATMLRVLTRKYDVDDTTARGFIGSLSEYA